MLNLKLGGKSLGKRRFGASYKFPRHGGDQTFNNFSKFWHIRTQLLLSFIVIYSYGNKRDERIHVYKSSKHAIKRAYYKTTDHRQATDRSSTNPPTTDPSTGPPTNHQSPTHRLTDPITIDQQPFDSPILFYWTNSFNN